MGKRIDRIYVYAYLCIYVYITFKLHNSWKPIMSRSSRDII